MPLALTDAQLASVTGTAALLPPGDPDQSAVSGSSDQISFA